MSGGIAYVLDPDDDFPERCNPELVELETPGAEDFEEIRALVEEHRDRTGSQVATHVLADWQGLIGSWVKVMPVDYKRALAEVAARPPAEAMALNGGDPGHDDDDDDPQTALALRTPGGDGDG
jgi:glutamate synthase domain-containing protein 3